MGENGGAENYLANLIRGRTVGFLPELKRKLGFDPACYLNYVLEALSYNKKPDPGGIVHLEIGLYEFMIMVPIGDAELIKESVLLLEEKGIIDTTYDPIKEIYTISRIDQAVLSLYGYKGE